MLCYVKRADFLTKNGYLFTYVTSYIDSDLSFYDQIDSFESIDIWVNTYCRAPQDIHVVERRRNST